MALDNVDKSLYEKCSDYYQSIPSIKEGGAVYSFILSAAITAVVGATPAAVLTSGAIGAVASVISSLAVPILSQIKPHGRTMEVLKRTVVLIAASFLVTGQSMVLRQLAIYLVCNAVAVLQSGRGTFEAKANEIYFSLRG